VLSDHERRFLLTRRVGHLATADSWAVPHVVPVCFTISQGTLYVTIDEKPKRVAGPALKRIRNIERNPMVAIVVDRYHEDWTRLGWVMLRGRAEILRAGTEHDRAQELLCSRYRQLAAMQIAELPVVAVRQNGGREHIDPSQQVVRRDHLVEAKLVKELPLIPVLPSHHRRLSCRHFSSRNHCSLGSSSPFSTASTQLRHQA
jgi:PPOX class probable F420-dependent enzyme